MFSTSERLNIRTVLASPKGKSNVGIPPSAAPRVIIWASVTGFESQVLRTIRKFDMIGPEHRVSVALSGGADSVALLLALVEIQPILECTLEAIHYHHGIRGEEADRDQEFVQSLCDRLGIKLRVGRRGISEALPGNLEEQLRDARYAYFARELVGRAFRLATGHTLDDQAETVLLKLARGAGPRGLAGIFPVRPLEAEDTRLKIIRPLLEVTREEVIQYLDERKTASCQDSSNQNLDFDRNWVRAHLIPSLEKRLNPKIKHSLGRTAELHRQLADMIEPATQDFLSRHSRREGDDILVSLKALRKTTQFWRGCYIREISAQIVPENQLESEHVRQIEDLFGSQPGRRFEGPAGLQVWRERNRLVFTNRVNPSPFKREFGIPGRISVPERKLVIEVRPATETEPEECCFRLAFPGTNLTLRTLRPGDRYRCLWRGKKKEMKVTEWLRQRRIPARLREGTLLLEGAGEVLWVEGLGVSSLGDPSTLEEPFWNVCVQESNETF